MALHDYCNLRIDATLTTTEERKPEPAPWATYDAYRAELAQGLAALDRNARDPARSAGYAMLATISAGYDSPAIAALAAEIGCTRGVTICREPSAGEWADGQEDSGEAIGRALGYDVEVIRTSPRFAGVRHTWPEFAACGEDNDQLYAFLETTFAGSLVLTGLQGDNHWGTDVKPSTDLYRGLEAVGGSLGEFRLRVGFLHVPLPYYGAVHPPALLKIGTSRRPPIGDDLRAYMRRYRRPHEIPVWLFRKLRRRMINRMLRICIRHETRTGFWGWLFRRASRSHRRSRRGPK